MDDLIARLPSEPGNPVVPTVNEPVKPGEAEIAQVCQDERALRHGGGQSASIEFLILVSVRSALDHLPQLTSDIEDGLKFARQQVPRRSLPEGRKHPPDLVQGSAIDGNHLCGEGDQRRINGRLQLLPKSGCYHSEEPFQGSGAALGQAFVDRLIRNEEAREVPDAVITQQPPKVQLSAEATQHTDQQSRPECESGQNGRPTWSIGGGGSGRLICHQARQKVLNLTGQSSLLTGISFKQSHRSTSKAVSVVLPAYLA